MTNRYEQIQKMKQARVEFNAALQQKYDKLESFDQQFDFIFDTLCTSQRKFAEWSGTADVLSEKNRQKIKAKLKTLENKQQFLNLLALELINPLGQGHCSLFVRPLVISDETRMTESVDIENPNNFTYSYPQRDTLYMKFLSFRKDFLKFDRTKLATLKNELESKNIKNVIIDIRGNGGGTDVYRAAILECLQSSAHYKVDWYNFFLEKHEGYEEHFNFGNKTYNMFVLIDDKVFSAAEITARTFKMSGATLVGCKTWGEGAGLSPAAMIKLANQKKDENTPPKGIYIRIPFEGEVNAAGEVDYTITQTHPDISCPKEDALSITLNYINSQKTKQNEIQK